jgi:hypothetical protein
VAKYAKPKTLRTRTTSRGLRPLPLKPLTPPPNLSQKPIEKMKKILFDEVLANGKVKENFNKRQLFVANHAYLVVLFHRGEKKADDIWTDGKNGHRVNFNQEEIDSLNFVVLEEKHKGQLDSLSQRLKEKIGAK